MVVPCIPSLLHTLFLLCISVSLYPQSVPHRCWSVSPFLGGCPHLLPGPFWGTCPSVVLCPGLGCGWPPRAFLFLLRHQPPVPYLWAEARRQPRPHGSLLIFPLPCVL